MTNLEKNAATLSERYSDADMLALLDNGIDGWQRDKLNIYLRPKRISAEVMLRNAHNDEVRVNYVQTDDFRAACKLLEGYLYGFSLPIDLVFSPASLNTSFKSEGKIKLESADSTTPVVLWVYYNVFLRLELFASEKSKSIDDSFPKLVKNLCGGIEDNSVSTQNEATFPNHSKIRGPNSVTAGNTFTVEVTAAHQNFHEVYCGSNVSFNRPMSFPSATANLLPQKIVYSGFKETDTGYIYTFLATEGGLASIIFCFAHHRTFNLVSQPWEIFIDHAAKSSISLDDVPVVR